MPEIKENKPNKAKRKLGCGSCCCFPKRKKGTEEQVKNRDAYMLKKVRKLHFTLP